MPYLAYALPSALPPQHCHQLGHPVALRYTHPQPQPLRYVAASAQLHKRQPEEVDVPDIEMVSTTARLWRVPADSAPLRAGRVAARCFAMFRGVHSLSAV